MKGNHRNQIEESMCLIVSYSHLLCLTLSYCLALSCSVLLSLVLSCSVLLCLTLSYSHLLCLALSYSHLLCLTLLYSVLLFLCFDEGLTLETSANTLFTAFNISTSTSRWYIARFTLSFLCRNCVLLRLIVYHCVLLCLNLSYLVAPVNLGAISNICFDKDDLTFLKPLQWVDQHLVVPAFISKVF